MYHYFMIVKSMFIVLKYFRQLCIITDTVIVGIIKLLIYSKLVTKKKIYFPLKSLMSVLKSL